MKGFAGYTFKPGFLGTDQCELLDGYIAESPNKNNDDSIVRLESEKAIYLLAKVPNELFVYGKFRNGHEHVEKDDTYAAFWGSNEEEVMNAAHGVGGGWDFVRNVRRCCRSFNVIVGELYRIDKDGAIWVSNLQKGIRVETPKGRGRIHDIDDFICVELDSESGILHEFNVDEVKKVKEG